MGGLAFADKRLDNGRPPQIPRMTQSLYQAISADCRSKLQTLFQHVVIPREAPAKLDYGDIDFLVAGIQSPISEQDVWRAVEHVLDARLHVQSSASHSFAIVHPEREEAYVQIDVELSPGHNTLDASELFEWTRFMKGDSDLLQIIGILHRPFGLTCNDKGLHVRVEEIEPYDKKKSLLFLTRDPNEAMQFYGFDTGKYKAGFQDESELFDWVSNGRFFSPSVFQNRIEKSNDRSRQTKRPLYRRFVEEYMPARADQHEENSWTRQSVLEEALGWFEKENQYNDIMNVHKRKVGEEELWKDIRAALPVEGNPLNMAIRALRRWVEFRDGRPYVANEAQLGDGVPWSSLVDGDSHASLLAWVKQNWEQVKALEKARSRRAKDKALVG